MHIPSSRLCCRYSEVVSIFWTWGIRTFCSTMMRKGLRMGLWVSIVNVTVKLRVFNLPIRAKFYSYLDAIGGSPT